ncbi:hypothetical protein ALDI51_32160 [Alicycliphilus denitrificans]|nr:hypothetical protein ALDI51_32160 [Alicycliphilus denitrificans]
MRQLLVKGGAWRSGGQAFVQSQRSPALKRRLLEKGATFGRFRIWLACTASALIRERRISLARMAGDLGFSDATTFPQANKTSTGVGLSRARVAPSA